MKKYSLPILLALFFALAACGFLPEDPPAPFFPDIEFSLEAPDDLPDAPNPRLPEYTALSREDDGILRLPMRVPLTLNPLLNRDKTVARVLGLLFEPLAVLDAELRPVGHLAELEFSLDFSGVVATIHHEAIWSDGMPVSSDDLIFSVEALRHAPEDAIYRHVVENIASITRMDERTAKIAFHYATPAAGYALLFPIIPRHYYLGETNPASARNLSPLGNGAFLFEGMLPLQSMRLVRNPNTFRPLPDIRQIEVLFLPDAYIDVHAFDRGLVDAIRLPFPEWARNPTAKELHTAVFPAMYFEFIGFNFTREALTPLNIRRGIAHAFDADEAIATLYLYHASRASAPIHPLSWMFDPTVAGYAYNPTRARTLLRPIARDQEEPLVILVGEENPERVAIAHRLATGLENAGLDAEVHALPGEAFLTRLAHDDYDLFVGWMELSFAPDFAFLFGGERAGGGLFSHDLYLEGLFAATRVATTESAFLQALSELQHAFAERLPVLGLAFRHSALLKSARVQTEAAPAPCRIFLHVNEWGL